MACCMYAFMAVRVLVDARLRSCISGLSLHSWKSSMLVPYIVIAARALVVGQPHEEWPVVGRHEIARSVADLPVEAFPLLGQDLVASACDGQVRPDTQPALTCRARGCRCGCSCGTYRPTFVFAHQSPCIPNVGGGKVPDRGAWTKCQSPCVGVCVPGHVWRCLQAHLLPPCSCRGWCGCVLAESAVVVVCSAPSPSLPPCSARAPPCHGSFVVSGPSGSLFCFFNFRVVPSMVPPMFILTTPFFPSPWAARCR